MRYQYTDANTRVTPLTNGGSNGGIGIRKGYLACKANASKEGGSSASNTTSSTLEGVVRFGIE